LTDDVVKVRKEWHAEKDGNQPFLTNVDAGLSMPNSCDSTHALRRFGLSMTMAMGGTSISICPFW
jgi:hypothetical protein